MRRRLMLVVLAALVAGCAAAGSPPARSSGSEPVHAVDRVKEAYSDAQLVRLLTQLGYEPVAIDEGAITFELGPAQVMLFNQWGGDLQLYYVVTGGRWESGGVNEWNRTRRLCRAYLDPDGDLVLEADLLTLGGVTDRQMGSFVAVFRKALTLFIEEVAGAGMGRDRRKEPPPTPVPEGSWH